MLLFCIYNILYTLVCTLYRLHFEKNYDEESPSWNYDSGYLYLACLLFIIQSREVETNLVKCNWKQLILVIKYFLF